MVQTSSHANGLTVRTDSISLGVSYLASYSSSYLPQHSSGLVEQWSSRGSRPTASSTQDFSEISDPIGAAPSTSPASATDSQAEFSTVIITASPGTPTGGSDAALKPTIRGQTSTIAGLSVGIPLGLAAVALLLYVLRRHHRRKVSSTQPGDTAGSSSFEPESKDFPGSGMYQKAELDARPKVHPKVELDTNPNTLAELPSTSPELDGTTAESRVSSTQELAGSDVIVTGSGTQDGQVRLQDKMAEREDPSKKIEPPQRDDEGHERKQQLEDIWGTSMR